MLPLDYDNVGLKNQFAGQFCNLIIAHLDFTTPNIEIHHLPGKISICFFLTECTM
jgi:hypothetical protein